MFALGMHPLLCQSLQREHVKQIHPSKLHLGKLNQQSALRNAVKPWQKSLSDTVGHNKLVETNGLPEETQPVMELAASQISSFQQAGHAWKVLT